MYIVEYRDGDPQIMKYLTLFSSMIWLICVSLFSLLFMNMFMCVCVCLQTSVVSWYTEPNAHSLFCFLDPFTFVSHFSLPLAAATQHITLLHT